jgi:adenylate kinase family enzyme
MKLGETLGLPVVHLDVLYWRPGWTPSDVESFRERVTKAIAGDGWIVDGNFSGFAFDLTLARADMLIVIERPRWPCLWRVLWCSAFQRHGRRRDLPVGCPEKFDWGLLRQTWRWPIDRLPRIEVERLTYGPDMPVLRLGSDREIARTVALSA